jgi:hypothetical protein
MSCPPKSPNLAPIDFFLWSHIKSLIYMSLVDCYCEVKNSRNRYERRVCSTHGKDINSYHQLVGILKECDHLEKPGLAVRMLLEGILK